MEDMILLTGRRTWEVLRVLEPRWTLPIGLALSTPRRISLRDGRKQADARLFPDQRPA